MKKISSLLMLFIAAFVLAIPTYAAETTELIDLYPANNPSHTFGSANWAIEFNGYRYHVVRGQIKFASDFVDADMDGFIQPAEIGAALSYSSIGGVFVNNTNEEVVMRSKHAEPRTDFTGVQSRMYSHFNAAGELVMFEDHITVYDLVKEVEGEKVSYRFATETEIEEDKVTAEANSKLPAEAEKAPLKTIKGHVRMVVDATDPRGYVMEAMTYLRWTGLGLEAAEDKSLILEHDPSDIVIPAGGFVLTHSTYERDGRNAKNVDFIKSFVPFIVAKGTAKVEMKYTTQAPEFAGTAALDKDTTVPGIDMIFEFNKPVDFNDAIAGVSASWLKMYDAGKIVNKTEKLNYKLEIYQGETLLETVNYVYDAETDKYTPSADVTAIKSDVFGASYSAKLIAVHPLEMEKVVDLNIAIGVLPPKFVGVAPRYSDEGEYVDLIGDVTANDGYKGDKTSAIEVILPKGFNQFAPKPGVYTIGLTFDHEVFIAGIPATYRKVSYDTTNLEFKQVNVLPTNQTTDSIIYTEDKISTYAFGFGNAFVMEIDETGKLVQSVHRGTWNTADMTNGKLDSAAKIQAWLKTVDFAGGHVVVYLGNTAAGHEAAKALLKDAQLTVDLTNDPGVPDFRTTITTTTSYKLTIEDVTAPNLLVLDDKYVVEADKYANVDQAILANVIALDNFDAREDLVIYILDKGGMALNKPGTYTVEVGVDDAAGNTTIVKFSVTVVEPKLTAEDLAPIENKVDENKEAQLTEEQIKAIIDAHVKPAPASLSPVVTILVAVGSAALAFAAAFILGKKK